MLGTIIGDIVGSSYEFKNCRRKDFQPFFHQASRFTDDTVCTIAVADSLLNNIHPADSLRKWGRRYWKNGGWGRSFALWLAEDEAGPYNSLGNGGAMRVSPAAFLASSLDEAICLANSVTSVTHNHPEGMKGADAIASAIFLAREGCPVTDLRSKLQAKFEYDLACSVDEIRPGYRHSERSADTVPQALICALEAVSFEDAIRNAVSIGGDSDTIAAMAGGVAEARFGLPPQYAEIAWKMLPQEMQAILQQLYERAVC